MTRNVRIGAGFVAALAVLGAGSAILDRRSTVSAATVMAPRFEVDPMWPKPLPNHWVQGMTIGVTADAKDNIWIIHRQGSLEPKEVYQIAKPTPAAECCTPAPPVLEFDQEGNLIGHWGGPGAGYDWPDSNHGITVDYKGNVWIGGNGRGPQPTPVKAETGITAEASSVAGRFKDNEILKFTQDGKFLMQIGKPDQSKGSNDIANLKGPAKLTIDPKTNELYVADGYGNHRVIVFDADSGKYKRHWGAYGHTPDDKDLGPYSPNDPLAQQFRNPKCIAPELLERRPAYTCATALTTAHSGFQTGWDVCERGRRREEHARRRIGVGHRVAPRRSATEVCFISRTERTRRSTSFQRDTMEILTSFGDGRPSAARLSSTQSTASTPDSKGNIYTTETYHGQRVQKFVYKGMAPVTKKDQGVVWPKKG